MKIYTTQVGPILTNCYLLCDEAAGPCALIDPGDEAGALEEMIAASGCALEMILLTHGHFDHCSAVREILSAHPDVPVYIHPSDVVPAGVYNDLKFARLDDHNQRFYGEGDTLTLGGLNISVLATPGHSSGSVCLIVENVIFSGDTLFRGTCGRSDFPDGSEEDILHSLARLARLEGSYHVCPGHESQTELDYERRVNPYVQYALRHF